MDPLNLLFGGGAGRPVHTEQYSYKLFYRPPRKSEESVEGCEHLAKLLYQVGKTGKRRDKPTQNRAVLALSSRKVDISTW